MNGHEPLERKIKLVWTGKNSDGRYEDTGDFASSSRRMSFDFAKASVQVSFHVALVAGYRETTSRIRLPVGKLKIPAIAAKRS
jgi:hypothetical protein